MRLFQDAAGTLPAFLAGHPVGKVVRAAGTVDAAQGTALSRPTLARWPKGGRRNLVPGSEFLSSGSAHAGETTRVSDAEPTPWGTRAPIISYAGTSPGRYTIYGTVDVIEGERYSFSMWIKLISGTSVSVYDPAIAGTVSVFSQLVQGEWVKVKYEGRVSNFTASRNLQLRLSDGGSVAVARVQYEKAASVTPYQEVASPVNVTEEGVPDIWHLWNDGGDSLPAVLPAGSYEIAWVTPLGAFSYAAVTSDGTAGTDLLRAERMADVIIRAGTFTATEKTALEAYWRQRYAA
ncbi:phage head spike fiber domain-containing protein [Falsigemmobacter faecalis]|uniref:Uncharacterized protein n=1 Tax=Falsigemmobacter faecalis TaxID=2488730 RepID=A0A3P3DAB3_9RHOB|nr:hypothetical protein [Falsigemmobacter faecalis]RRH71275.1 hypothetical protein EG244_16495 [Falsigemmobacter faecalis]